MKFKLKAAQTQGEQIYFDSINGGLRIILKIENNKIKIYPNTLTSPEEFNIHYSLKLNSEINQDEIQQKIISGGKQNVNQNYSLFGLLSRSIWHLLLQHPTILGRRTVYKRERNHRGFNTQRNRNERLQ